MHALKRAPLAALDATRRDATSASILLRTTTRTSRFHDPRRSVVAQATRTIPNSAFRRQNQRELHRLGRMQSTSAAGTPTPMSDFDNMRRSATPRTGAIRGSSARPGGPPSESAAAQSDDEGFADDQVPVNPNRPRNNRDRPIPRVEDKVGLVVQETFERFIET